MTLVTNNTIDLVGAQRALNNCPCFSLVLTYVGDPNCLDERAMSFLWQSIADQATRLQDLSREHFLFTRFVVTLDLPSHLSSAKKMEGAFSIIGQFTEDLGDAVELESPAENPSALELMAPILETTSAMEDEGLNALLQSLYISTDLVPVDILIGNSKMEKAEKGRRWMASNVEALMDKESLSLSVSFIPAEICYLKGLTSLSISDADVAFVPPQIGELENLEIVNLSQNNLHSLPNGVTNLKKLQNLDLSNNKLETLPALDEIPSLQVLNISRNPISLLESPCLEKLEKRGCTIMHQMMH